MLIVDLETDSPPPGLEARLNLQIPALPAEGERLLDAAFVETLEATLIRPTPQPGNQPWNFLGPGFEIKTLKDIGCHEEIEETEPTLEGNALLKARYVKKIMATIVFQKTPGWKWMP